MTLKLSRRDFLKSTAALPSLLALPAWPSSAYQPKTDLVAVDFVWTCADPFFENDRDFYLGDSHAVLFDEVYDAEDLTSCLANRTFERYVCGKTFLVRLFQAGQEAGHLTDDQALASPSFRSKNPLTSFYCPICGTGWWLGRAAKGFERTFFFSVLDGASPVEGLRVSKAVLEPPVDWTYVKDGQQGRFNGELPDHEDDQAYKSAQLDWAVCNAHLPNQARFTI